MNEVHKSPHEVNMDIAHHVIALRKSKKLSQQKLSKLSGVSLGSLKRFEEIGEISLIHLSQIAVALGIEEELDHLFEGSTLED